MLANQPGKGNDDLPSASDCSSRHVFIDVVEPAAERSDETDEAASEGARGGAEAAERESVRVASQPRSGVVAGEALSTGGWLDGGVLPRMSGGMASGERRPLSAEGGQPGAGESRGSARGELVGGASGTARGGVAREPGNPNQLVLRDTAAEAPGRGAATARAADELAGGGCRALGSGAAGGEKRGGGRPRLPSPLAPDSEGAVARGGVPETERVVDSVAPLLVLCR